MPKPVGKRIQVAEGAAWCGRQLLVIVLTAVVVGIIYFTNLIGYLIEIAGVPVHYALLIIAGMIVSFVGIVVWLIMYSIKYTERVKHV